MATPREALLCACHHEPQRWHKDDRRKNGGYWRCRVRSRELWAAYNATDEGRERRRRYEDSLHARNRKQWHEMTRVRVR